MEIYVTGNRATEAGAIPAKDMTLDAAQQKLMYALGKFKAKKLAITERGRYVREAFA